MRPLHLAFVALIVSTVAPTLAESEPSAGWLPERCRLAIEADPRPWAKADETAEARWNRFYSTASTP